MVAKVIKYAILEPAARKKCVQNEGTEACISEPEISSVRRGEHFWRSYLKGDVILVCYLP